MKRRFMRITVFLTLTYRDDDLPIDGSLVKWHFQDFMKRLRRKYNGTTIRFFMCGEYGERLSRPHYHACLFGFDFPDKLLLWKEHGIPLYSSASLDERWGFGFCSIGDVSFDSAMYVASYCVKKITGAKAAEHYMRVCPVTGECFFVEPEFTLMSRGGRRKGRHGIGADWYDQFSGDVFPEDEVVLEGRLNKPPRYYSEMFREDDPDGFGEMKAVRDAYFAAHAQDCTPERLRVRETVLRSRLSTTSRSYENDC